jgi:hypothetical protein
MKVVSLQFGKAISAALFVLLLNVAGMKNALAQTQTATLQHAGNISAFTGPNAFAQAHSAAADGDTITLSSGNFDGCDITKAITLHGAGCVSDTLGIMPTQISGNVDNYISNDSMFMTIEGIAFSSMSYINIKHAKFIRCNISSFVTHNLSWESMEDVQFINCLVDNISVRSGTNSVFFINCVVNNLYNTNLSNNAVLAFNSIINIRLAGNSSHNMHLYNCILGNAHKINGTRAYNCIQVGSTFPSSVQTVDCMTVSSYSDVFENWDGNFSFDADFSLKEEIATGFLGTDGTEVGIFGGMMPYNPRPSYLISYRCTVASRTTVDGKLSVDVEVVTGDQ